MKFVLMLVCLSLSFISFDGIAQSNSKTNHKEAKKNEGTKKKRKGISSSFSFETKFMRTYEAGKTYSDQIEVVNQTNEDRYVKLTVEHIYLNQDGKAVREKELAKEKNKESFVKQPFLDGNIGVPQGGVLLKAGETKSIPISFNIPKDAKGTYFFHYTINDRDQRMVEKTLGIKSPGQAAGGIKLIMIVYGTGVISIKNQTTDIVESKNSFSYDKKTKSLTVESIVENNGNKFYYDFKGDVLVFKKGNLLGKFVVHNISNKLFFFPQTKFKYAGMLNLNLEPDEYDIIISYKDSTGDKAYSFKDKIIVK